MILIIAVSMVYIVVTAIFSEFMSSEDAITRAMFSALLCALGILYDRLGEVVKAIKELKK